ncbi:sensor histidine kinase [Microbacterium radiodurans]|uniref:histidine kinase n=1 Tax=Microbacterium radiodurans TaxID=661398 RepID=A0A5J5IS11_9MICO|nr:ATP-binding protein [Microbacterium radiodurans]KAA9087080.1 histidine kinase [Microbacterium radiodurans]
MTTSPVTGSPDARTRILPVLLLHCLVVLTCVLTTTLIATAVQERSIREATERRVLDVATSLADLEQVRAALRLDRASATAELQPVADLIEEAAGVDYVVVTDAAGIRITHPTPDQRGLVVSTDPSDVLAGQSFVGTETGTLGPTLRAKVPVLDGDAVIGTASVGILESDIAADFSSAVTTLIPWVVVSILVGCVVSAAATTAMGRRVRALENRARWLQTQQQVADALRDQTHEFHTRLHVIRGLVAEGETDAALDYIGRVAPVTTAAVGAGDIADPALRAVLEAESARLRERGGALAVDPLSVVPRDSLDDDDITVVANLVRNAVDAASAHVEVLVTAADRAVHVRVDDDGPGVAPADVARIFQRGASSKGAQRGVGLDLVRRLVSARGGTITVERSARGGARFVVDAPQHESRPRDARDRGVTR